MSWTPANQSPLVVFMQKLAELCKTSIELHAHRQTHRALQQIRATLYSTGAISDTASKMVDTQQPSK